ncbi:MAG: hypothetical protein LBH38_02205 [Holosporales bacterium]|nr:hypothetical protein [Holosporales bacterium]
MKKLLMVAPIALISLLGIAEAEDIKVVANVDPTASLELAQSNVNLYGAESERAVTITPSFNTVSASIAINSTNSYKVIDNNGHGIKYKISDSSNQEIKSGNITLDNKNPVKFTFAPDVAREEAPAGEFSDTVRVTISAQ